MSPEYVTLSRGDADFEPYLLGTFASERRALPVETFQGPSNSERVTFRVVSLEKLEIPAWWRVYWRASRPELALLSMGPAMAAWLNHYGSISEWSEWPSWFALLGIFFLQTAVLLFIDYQDHMQGADRVNRRRGPRVIQKGWVTAVAVRRYAWINAGVALAFGLPALSMAPFELAVLCAISAVAILAVTSRWTRRWGLSDLGFFALFGPLLTTGVALASFAEFTSSDLLLGGVFGATALWVFHVRQFEFLFRSKAENFRTFLFFFPFDRAKRWVIGETALVALLQVGVAMNLRVPIEMLAMVVPVCAPMAWTAYRLSQAISPLSSSLLSLSRYALAAQAAWACWWVFSLGLQWL
ncbi:MAG: prenyltransferase [Bdellovibrionales bacterium]